MIIYKDMSNKVLIKTCVRLNKSNQLELFYYDEYKTLVAFTYAEGHNDCCLNYMYSCKLVDKLTATMFLIKYNTSYKVNVEHVFAQRLSKKGI